MPDVSDKPVFTLERAGVLASEAAGRFRALEPARRRQWVVMAVLVVSSLFALLWFAGRTDWRILYAGLDPDDARQMAQQLTAAGIPFDVSPDGASLRVPAQNLDKARLATTAKGGPKSGRMGFELFDKPNWMGSEFDEKVNYQRALEGELEHTISTLGAVQSARVHLVLPHESLFTTQEREAKASVVLRLRHRTVSDEEAEAVSNLVASAVEGLRPENVVLVDADGHGILGRRGGDPALAAHEQQLAARLVETLEPVAGVGNVRASVNVEYDSSSADEVDETYDPAQTVTLSMQRTEQTSGQPSASGIPGTASNAPNVKPPLYPATAQSQQNLKQESGTYGVSRKVRHTIQAAGRIRRVSAAVLINYRRAGQGKQVSWQPRTPDEMKRLSDLAASAIGFDISRGDQVSVEELAFDDNFASADPGVSERVLSLVTHSQDWLRSITILLGILLFVFFVARPAVRALSSKPSSPRAAALSTGPTQVVAEPVSAELNSGDVAAEQRRQRAQNVFDQVSEHVKREPAQSTRLIESWIRSE